MEFYPLFSLASDIHLNLDDAERPGFLISNFIGLPSTLFSSFPLSPGLNILDGIFHGLVFSSPFSAPILISIYRFLIEGPISGLLSTFGTVFGQLAFFSFLRSGMGGPSSWNSEHNGILGAYLSSFLSFWYTFEPALSLLGFLISFKIATDFWTGQALLTRDTSVLRGAGSGSGKEFTIQGIVREGGPTIPFFLFFGESGFLSLFLRSFGLNFILMLLNPSLSGNSSRIILSAPNLLPLESSCGLFDKSCWDSDSSAKVFESFTKLVGPGYSLFNYNIGFFISAFIMIGLVWPLIFSFVLKSFSYLVPTIFTKRLGYPFLGPNNFQRRDQTSEAAEKGSGRVVRDPLPSPSWKSKLVRPPYPFQSSPQIERGFFSFLIIGCLLNSFLQYNWRLFTQYPLEILNGTSFGNNLVVTERNSVLNLSETEGHPIPSLRGVEKEGVRPDGVPLTNDTTKNLNKDKGANTNISENTSEQNLFQNAGKQFFQGSGMLLGQPILPVREFPSFDSNIRHRDKNLPVDRHLPIEKMNTRRTLSGRSPLNEEQKSDAYFRFNSFFINNLEGKLENKLINFRNRVPLDGDVRKGGPTFHTGKTFEASSPILLKKVVVGWDGLPLTIPSNKGAVEMLQNNWIESERVSLHIAEYLEKVKEVLSSKNPDLYFGHQLAGKGRGEGMGRDGGKEGGPNNTFHTRDHTPRILENNTKGKPPKGFSFISENLDTRLPQLFDSKDQKQKNPYLHDELQMYAVLFNARS